MKLTVRVYQTQNGSSPVAKYLKSLEEPEAARILAVFAEIQSTGLKSPFVQSRLIRGKLWELKLGKHRVFYVLISGAEMLLLHACKKQSQKARQRELSVALSRMKHVLGPE